MRPQDRIVTRIPMTELWDDSGVLPVRRLRDIGVDDVVAIFRLGATPKIVIADVGQKLRWVGGAEVFSVWKSEIKPRLVLADANRFSPDEFPNDRCFVGSEWGAEDRAPILLFESHH